MSNIIEFKRPEPKKECKHESIDVDFNNHRVFCADCYLDVSPFYVLYKFMACTKWKNNVNLQDLEYLIDVVRLHKSIDSQRDLLDKISNEVTNKFKELHALEINIQEKINMLGDVDK